MKLADTAKMMNSDDFMVRFRAEYFQLSIRRDGLASMLQKYKLGTLTFKPNCSYELLHRQLVYMNSYLDCLEERAKIENINLDMTNQ